MRLVLDRRARRLLARMPLHRWYSVAELALLALLALQCARLLLTIATPVGPIGDWRPDAGRPTATTDILGTFDPFFRLATASGPAAVTGLDIKLFGIRADQASGRGSAILGLASGAQSSVAVGEEIMPGVTLKAVAFDHVVIRRGANDEQLFLDQSRPATIVSPASPAGVAMPAPVAGLVAGVQFLPRIGKDGVDGFIVQPRGDAAMLVAAGLVPGDVILSVNGMRVRNAGDAAQVQQQLGRSGEAALVIEREGAELPLRVRTGQ